MAEGTRLLSEYGVDNSIEGSNPSLSAGRIRCYGAKFRADDLLPGELCRSDR